MQCGLSTINSDHTGLIYTLTTINAKAIEKKGEFQLSQTNFTTFKNSETLVCLKCYGYHKQT